MTGGDPLARTGWCGWFSKQDGIRYPQLRADLDEQLNDGVITAVWQRQLVLGPAPEFRILAPGPVTLASAELSVGLQVDEPQLSRSISVQQPLPGGR